LTLLQIHSQIDERTSAIIQSRGWWPCRKGCDACCRHLASIPELTEAELELLQTAIRELPIAVQNAVRRRIQAMTTQVGRPYVCPFLAEESGACQVYASRPVACRTYGFYIEQQEGLYCGEIHEGVERGEFANVVWGNQTGVERSLDQLGARIRLTDWFDGTARRSSSA
jgi:Fe-S-cluster containining protein